MFNLITGYLKADAGSVRFGGEPVRRPNPRRLYRHGLSRTFQQARVFPEMTLVENLVVAVAIPAWALTRRGISRADAGRAGELLERFGLAGHAHHRAKVAPTPVRRRNSISRLTCTGYPPIGSPRRDLTGAATNGISNPCVKPSNS